MELKRHSQELEYKWKDVTFRIRERATRGDQYDMNAAMLEGTEVKDGRVIRTNAARLFPWLIERFVMGWSGVHEGGKPAEWSLANLRALPAEPGEDLIMVLGSYILNHTGIVPEQEHEDRKKS